MAGQADCKASVSLPIFIHQTTKVCTHIDVIVILMGLRLI